MAVVLAVAVAAVAAFAAAAVAAFGVAVVVFVATIVVVGVGVVCMYVCMYVWDLKLRPLNHMIVGSVNEYRFGW